MNLRLEHIYSFTKAKRLEDHLKLYRKAGFIVDRKTVRHPPGLRNGFIRVGSEYLELCWVEDKKEFRNNRGKEIYPDILRTHPAPYGYGFDSPSIRAVHHALVKRGFKIPETYTRAAVKDPEKFHWEFQIFPKQFFPGVFAFGLTYIARDYKKPRSVRVGKNKIAALKGVTFVCKNPKRDAGTWARVFKKEAKVKDGVWEFMIGKHLLRWMTEKEFVRCYGYAPALQPSDHYTGPRTTAAINLCSSNLTVTDRYLRKAGWKTKMLSTQTLLVFPRHTDGYAFLIQHSHSAAT